MTQDGWGGMSGKEEPSAKGHFVDRQWRFSYVNRVLK